MVNYLYEMRDKIMNENKILHYDGGHNIYELEKKDIERFISMFLFPISTMPPLAVLYLKQKNFLLLQYISEYILKNNETSASKPLTRDELIDIIYKALIENGVNIKEIRSFNEQEVIDWKNDGKDKKAR